MALKNLNAIWAAQPSKLSIRQHTKDESSDPECKDTQGLPRVLPKLKKIKQQAKMDEAKKKGNMWFRPDTTAAPKVLCVTLVFCPNLGQFSTGLCPESCRLA